MTTTAVDAETALRMLGDSDTASRVDGDVFTIVARHADGTPELCCTFQMPMAKLDREGLWGLSLRLPDLNEAIIDYFIFPPSKPGPLVPAVWRGPDAPPAPKKSSPMAGQVIDYTLHSEIMGEARKLSVYLPPQAKGAARLPVLYLADGAAAHSYAPIVEALIMDGEIPPIVVVGLWSGPVGDRKPGDPDWRAQEYLVGFPGGADRHALHRRFFLEEVIPLAERLFYASAMPHDRMVAGQSNGGAWAFQLMRDHPQEFRKGLLMSAAGAEPTDFAMLEGARLFTGVGVFETQLIGRAPRVAQKAEAAGAAVRYRPIVGGHSPFVWDVLLAEGLPWLLNDRQRR